MAVAVITESSGPVGSTLVAHLDERGWPTHGINDYILAELAVAGER
jgi:hypothetical protein